MNDKQNDKFPAILPLYVNLSLYEYIGLSAHQDIAVGEQSSLGGGGPNGSPQMFNPIFFKIFLIVLKFSSFIY